ncbi:MAG: hypothetical protein J5757_02055 [Lachnospiraceae bacterium]|nr:hypothetical protein [Lachnospiraceae bacterium]
MRRRGFAFLLAASLAAGSLFGCKKGGEEETSVATAATTAVTTAPVTSEENATGAEPGTPQESTEDPTVVSESLDVQKYFEERAEVISITPVKDSKNTLSEKDVVNELRERGFSDCSIMTCYSVDGSFIEAAEVSSGSSETHPIYDIYYVTSKNELWVITVIDGLFFAYPSSYNLEHMDKVPVEFSETRQIASYDSSTNSIYLTIPKETVLDVRVIDKIDAKTLESINLEEVADETK